MTPMRTLPLVRAMAVVAGARDGGVGFGLGAGVA